MKLLFSKLFLLRLLTILGLCLSMPALAEEIEIDETLTKINLSTRVDVLRIDESRQFSFIQTLQSWQTEQDIEPLHPGDALWGKLTVANRAAQTLDAHLIMANPGLNKLDWYVLDSKDRIRYSHFTGTDRADDLHPIKGGSFILPVSFQPLETLSLYFKMSDDGPMIMPLTLASDQQWQKDQQQHLWLTGFINGALIILALYFMIVYVLRRTPVRFWLASSCLAALLLFSNIQGSLTQWLELVPYMSFFTTVLLTLSLLCLVKVSHSVLYPVSTYWRYTVYILCLAMFSAAFILDAYWQLVISTSISTAILIIQLLLGIRAIQRHNRLPTRLFILGWLLITVAGITQAVLYLNGIIVDRQTQISLLFMVLGGGIFIALANEAFEQSARIIHQAHQNEVITDLKQFYQLVHHSAEGLYSSTLEGQLISVNPAMSRLFGYESEQQMLKEVKNTQQLYRHEEDRKKLLKELHHKGMVLRQEIRGNKRDGSDFWFSNSVQMKEQDDQPVLFGSVMDISDRKRNNMSLAYLASHDPLTGTYNHREFERRLNKALQHAKQSNAALSLLVMEIRQFHQVNETCGYDAGNILLQQLSQKMHDVVSSRAILAKLNNHHFAILLEGELATQTKEIAQQLQQACEDFTFSWETHHFNISLNIGIADCEKETQSPQQLISMANSACYNAAQQTEKHIYQYSHQGTALTHFQTDQNWLAMLNKALENNKFELYFQHYHPLKSIDGHHQYEILLRMNTPIQDNLISPSSFLPTAERHSLMPMIDAWVVEHYFQWLTAHPQHLQQLQRCNINLSGFSVADNELKLFLLNAFEQYAIPYEKICFELTENEAMVRMDDTQSFIKTFANLGCTFALDDFGNELSSYTNLKKLPVDFVKIDGSLIKDLLVGSIDTAMVRAIHDIASTIGVQTIAEFVESKDIMVELGKLGIDYAQGYAIAKPQPLDQFSAYSE